jgi:uncharacterized protein (TIGR02118 family)
MQHIDPIDWTDCARSRMLANTGNRSHLIEPEGNHPMSVKLVVLYPQPMNIEEFERRYHAEHLPLMRSLVGPNVPLPTYRVRVISNTNAPYYRIAEIHFADLERFRAFVDSDGSGRGRASSLEVSTGGLPTFLVCESD